MSKGALLAAALGRLVWDGTSSVVVIVSEVICDDDDWDQMCIRHCTSEDADGGYGMVVVERASQG